MTAKELIENMEKLGKAYDALGKEFDRRSKVLREMTEKKNEKPTVEQINWLKKLKERDYKAFLCQGFDEAKRVIDWYFEVEK